MYELRFFRLFPQKRNKSDFFVKKNVLKIAYIIPFRFHRITRRQGGGAAGVYEHTSRKPTTKSTKLAEESGTVF